MLQFELSRDINLTCRNKTHLLKNIQGDCMTGHKEDFLHFAEYVHTCNTDVSFWQQVHRVRPTRPAVRQKPLLQFEHNLLCTYAVLVHKFRYVVKFTQDFVFFPLFLVCIRACRKCTHVTKRGEPPKARRSSLDVWQPTALNRLAHLLITWVLTSEMP
jgi:hypothetical protein